MRDAASTALAHSWRREGNREEAARIWRELIEAHRGGLRPYIELAKYEEHIRRDLPAALALTEKALSLANEARLPENGTVQELKNELQYRHQRLKRKLKEQ